MADDPTRPIETPPDPQRDPGSAAPGTGADAPPAVEVPPAATTESAPPATADSAPTMTSVQPPSGPNRLRWAIGLGVAGLAIAIGIAAVLIFGSRPVPEALKYIPGDASLVAEIRMDLPGDQLQKLGTLLAHFPGFADQSTLPAKLDESFSRIVRQGGSDIDYVRDIKPWLSGPTFISFRTPPSGAAGEAASPDRGVISATTTGTVTCETPFKGQPVTREPYRGLELNIGARGDVACVIDGRQALIGDPQSVREALDAKANASGIDRNDDYKAARAAVAGDQLATVFLRGQALLDMMPAPSAAPLPGLGALGNIRGGIPAWTMVAVRAENDALVVEGAAAPVPAPSGGASFLPLPATHASALAAMVPSDTILLVENQGTGVTLQNTLTQLRSIPELSAPLQMLEGMAGGGSLVGWIEDAGIVALADGAEPSVGLLLLAADANAASQRVATINSLIGLLGLQTQGIEIRQSDVAGVQVTTVTITDVGALGGLVPPGSIPGGQVPASGPVSFSFAARDRAVIVASGEAFVRALVNPPQGQRLSDNAGYKHALERGLPGSRTSMYVGVPAGIELAKTLLPSDVLGRFEADVLPYLQPFEALYLSANEDAAAPRSRLVVTVTQP